MLVLSATDAREQRTLAERIRLGDPLAEAELVREFSQRIFVMSVSRTRDREGARDLVQDTLIAVLAALRKGQLQDPDKLAAFVHGTARNLISNRLRREGQRPPTGPLPEEVAGASMSEELESAERVRLVQESLSHLALQDRQILWMTLVEGRKPGEIAAALALSSDVVRTRKARAARKVADYLKKKMSRTQANLPHR